MQSIREKAAMVANHHPTELLKLIDPDRVVEHYRNLFCDHYDGCLDEAVNKRWTSWTCARCMLFAVRPKAKTAERCGATA